MTVFKAYLKILLKNKIVVGINFIIFVGVILLMTAGANFEEDVLERIRVGVIHNYENTKNNGLVRFIEETFDVVEIENDEVEIKMALFYNEVHYVLIINEDGFQSYQVPNSTIGFVVEGHINNYLNTFELIRSAGTVTNEEEIINQTIENINLRVDVLLEIDDESAMILGFYYNIFVYGGLGAIVTGIGVTMIAFNRKTVHDRTVVSSTKLTKRNMHLTLSSLVFSLIIWGVTVIIGWQISGVDLGSDVSKMFMINSFMFVLVCCTLAFLLSQFIKKMIVLSAVVTVVSLVLSFISGAFVPQFLLNEVTRSIAQFTPTYWFIRNNDLITDMTTFNLDPLMNGMLIQAGFATAFIALALAVSKYKMERK